jgi:hypothetical protein
VERVPGKRARSFRGAAQREALKAVLETIKPEVLTIPRRILDVLPPRAFGFGGGTAEYFSRRTSPDFDPIGAATIAADMAISGLLNPQRAARLTQFHALDATNPDFSEVLAALISQTWNSKQPVDAFQAAIGMAVGSVVVTRIMELAANAEADAQVRSQAMESLRNLQSKLAREVSTRNRLTEAQRGQRSSVFSTGRRRSTRRPQGFRLQQVIRSARSECEIAWSVIVLAAPRNPVGAGLVPARNLLYPNSHGATAGRDEPCPYNFPLGSRITDQIRRPPRCD